MAHSVAYPKIIALGGVGIGSIFDEDVEITEKLDGCVTPQTLILMSDLTYKPAGLLEIGDSLVGFDEEMNASHIRESKVTFTGRAKKECAEVEFADGRFVIATLDHPFVVRYPHKTPGGLSKRYVEVKDLKVGQKVVDFGRWYNDNDYDTGYVAGQFDGEGSLVGNSQQNSNWGHLTYYQNEGKGMDVIEKIIHDKGFVTGRGKRQRDPKWGVNEYLRINGGWSEWIRFLGTFRPQRLLDGFGDKILWNRSFNGVKDNEVVKITPIGFREIVTLSTSTHTYVANGFCSHNSQFGFGMVDGQLVCRSKGKEIDLDNPDKMFTEGVEYVKSIKDKLEEGFFFYGEYLQKPRHSTLAYNSIPKNHIALFGVLRNNPITHEIHMVDYVAIKDWAERLNVDAIPLIYQGKATPEIVKELLNRESYLGGQDIEGVVVKNYKPWMFMDRIIYPVMAGKFVTEKFKEVHQRDWSKLNTGKGQLGAIADKYRSEARWHKAVMKMKEEGRYTQSVKDIGELIKIVRADLVLEEKENIKNDLYRALGEDVIKHSVFRLPQWVKEQLLLGEDNGQ